MYSEYTLGFAFIQYFYGKPFELLILFNDNSCRTLKASGASDISMSVRDIATAIRDNLSLS